MQQLNIENYKLDSLTLDQQILLVMLIDKGPHHLVDLCRLYAFFCKIFKLESKITQENQLSQVLFRLCKAGKIQQYGHESARCYHLIEHKNLEKIESEVIQIWTTL